MSADKEAVVGIFTERGTTLHLGRERGTFNCRACWAMGKQLPVCHGIEDKLLLPDGHTPIKGSSSCIGPPLHRLHDKDCRQGKEQPRDPNGRGHDTKPHHGDSATQVRDLGGWMGFVFAIAWEQICTSDVPLGQHIPGKPQRLTLILLRTACWM